MSVQTSLTLAEVGSLVERRPESRQDVSTLIEHFAALARSANGMNAVRQLVVDLAVRGRLAEQSAADGLGTTLLEAIRNARQKAGVQGNSMRDRNSAGRVEEPFRIPANWSWSSLGTLAVKLGAGSTPLGGKSVYKVTGVKFLRSQNIWNDGLKLTNVACIDRETHARMAGTHVEPGDILLNITGASIGRSAVVPDDFDEGNVSQHVAIVRLAEKAIRRFVHLAMTSSYFQEFIMAVQVGVSREGLSMKKLQFLPIPLPPIAEQTRIIAKVDQLMALCDELEMRQTRERAVGRQLTASALDALCQARNKTELEDAWRRVVDNFDTVVSNTEAVEFLRGSIRQLGISGKLSNADIAPVSADTQQHFAIPTDWEWTRLGAVCVDSFYGPRFAKGDYVPHGGIPTIRTTDMTPQGEVDMRDPPRVRVPSEKAEIYKLVAGDLLVTRTGSIGTTAVFRGTFDAIPSAYLIRFRFSSAVEPDFVQLFLKAPFGQRLLGLGTSRVAQPNINAETIKNLPLPLPPIAEQRRIVAQVRRLLQSCEALESSLNLEERRAAALAGGFTASLFAHRPQGGISVAG